MAAEKASVCRWTNQAQAFAAFADFTGKTQSANHIKPLHWYVACRLVIEGGFHPDDITPRPPFKVVRKGRQDHLIFDPSLGRGGERTVLGGLKTKNVDVVVTREGLGPVLAISCKGVTKAFRNLTNRMEETIGECTNLHITYPALVLGFFVIIRANRQAEATLAGTDDVDADPVDVLEKNDVALSEGGEPIAGILRFHNALQELTGRHGIRDDISRYESVALSMVDMRAGLRGDASTLYPNEHSRLRLEHFFDTLYLRYDERYVLSAPDLKKVTRRLEWASDSPALEGLGAIEGLDYEARTFAGLGDEDEDEPA